MDCDFCGQNPATLICGDCLQGAWCSEKCHIADAADHEDYDCFHPEDLSDECVLEDVEYQVTDPEEARQLLHEHIGEELIGIDGNTRRMRRRRRKLGRKRRGQRRKRTASQRERRRLRREGKRSAKEERRYQREQGKAAVVVAGGTAAGAVAGGALGGPAGAVAGGAAGAAGGAKLSRN